ncbi:hypothetical protein ACLOJK_020884 [Asimina triloba]
MGYRSNCIKKCRARRRRARSWTGSWIRKLDRGTLAGRKAEKRGAAGETASEGRREGVSGHGREGRQTGGKTELEKKGRRRREGRRNPRRREDGDGDGVVGQERGESGGQQAGFSGNRRREDVRMEDERSRRRKLRLGCETSPEKGGLLWEGRRSGTPPARRRKLRLGCETSPKKGRRKTQQRTFPRAPSREWGSRMRKEGCLGGRTELETSEHSLL